MKYESGKLGSGADAPKPLKVGGGLGQKARAKAKKSTAESLGQVVSAKPKVSKTGNRPAAPSRTAPRMGTPTGKL